MAVAKTRNFRGILYVLVKDGGVIHIDKGQGRSFCGRTWVRKAPSHQSSDRCATCLKLSTEGPKK